LNKVNNTRIEQENNSQSVTLYLCSSVLKQNANNIFALFVSLRPLR